MPIDNSAGLVACCGLYCGVCGAYVKGKCAGCAKNEKAAWCKVRKCCMENKYQSCADCGSYVDKADCNKLNNVISRLIGIFTGSDRIQCINRISETGPVEYAKYMSANGLKSISKHQGY